MIKTDYEQFSLENGKIHGEYKRFYPNGKIFSHGYYHLGLLHGIFQSYDEAGNLIARIPYENGMIHGRKMVFYPSGKLYYEGLIVNDLRQGLHLSYYSNEKIMSEMHFLDDKLHGLCVLYYKNGAIKKKFQAHFGSITGELS